MQKHAHVYISCLSRHSEDFRFSLIKMATGGATDAQTPEGGPFDWWEQFVYVGWSPKTRGC